MSWGARTGATGAPVVGPGKVRGGLPQSAVVGRTRQPRGQERRRPQHLARCAGTGSNERSHAGQQVGGGS